VPLEDEAELRSLLERLNLVFKGVPLCPNTDSFCEMAGAVSNLRRTADGVDPRTHAEVRAIE
jgi:hypothetical protein